MDWSREDSLLLIQEYRKYQLLWDPKHKNYFNKLKKNEAWTEIANTFNTDVDKARSKMASLLGSFRRERGKGRKIIGTGTAAKEVYKSKWFAFKSLLFLIERNKLRRTDNKYGENSCLDVTKTEFFEEELEHLPQDDGDPLEGEITENSLNSENDEDGNEHLHTDHSQNLKTESKILKSAIAKTLRTSNSASAVEDTYVEAALNFQHKSDDPDMVYAQYVASKLKQFSGKSRVLVEHAINQIIFEAEMKLYDANFVPCNLNQNE